MRRAAGPQTGQWFAGIVGVLAAAAATVIFVGLRADVSIEHSSISILADDLMPTLALLVALMLIGFALVMAGRSRVFWVPAVAYAMLPLLTGGPSNCVVDGARGPGSLVAIAVPSERLPGLGDCAWTTAATLPRVAVDIGLALLPAAVLVVLMIAVGSRREKDALSGFRLALSDVCAFALLAASVALLWGVALPANPGFPPGGTADAAVWMPLFLFGALLGTHRRVWLWSLLVVPWLWSTWGVADISRGSDGQKMAAMFAAALLGALTDRLGPALRWVLRKSSVLARAAPDGTRAVSDH